MDIAHATDNLLTRLAATNSPLQRIAGRMMFARLTKQLSNLIVCGDANQIHEVSKSWLDCKSRFDVHQKAEMQLAKAVIIKANRLTNETKPGCVDSPILDPGYMIRCIHQVPSRIVSLSVVNVISEVAATYLAERKKLRIFEPAIITFSSQGDSPNLRYAMQLFSSQLSPGTTNTRADFYRFCAKQIVMGDHRIMAEDKNGLPVCALACASECFDRQSLLTACGSEEFFPYYLTAFSDAIIQKKIKNSRVTQIKKIAQELSDLGYINEPKLGAINSL